MTVAKRLLAGDVPEGTTDPRTDPERRITNGSVGRASKEMTAKSAEQTGTETRGPAGPRRSSHVTQESDDQPAIRSWTPCCTWRPMACGSSSSPRQSSTPKCTCSPGTSGSRGRRAAQPWRPRKSRRPGVQLHDASRRAGDLTAAGRSSSRRDGDERRCRDQPTKPPNANARCGDRDPLFTGVSRSRRPQGGTERGIVQQQLGIVPSAVELREWRLLVSSTKASMLRHVRDRADGRRHRVQGGEQTRQVAAAADPPGDGRARSGACAPGSAAPRRGNRRPP